MPKQIQLAVVLTILSVSASSVRRLIKDSEFPKPEKIGGKFYFKTDSVYAWISKKAGWNVVIGDKLYSSKKLEAIFDRSRAWVWMHFQKNKERKAKVIYLRSRPYWLKSYVLADPELKKHLEITKSEVV